MCRKGDVCSDEGPKVKKKMKAMYLLEKGGQRNENYSGQMPLHHQEKVRHDQKRH